MNTNSAWGALGFLTATKPSVAAEGELTMTVESRLLKARELPKTKEGFQKAAELRVWLSSSKKGGALPLEKMDVAYMTNILKMIAEDRHPTIKKGGDAAAQWTTLLKCEIDKAMTERGDS